MTLDLLHEYVAWTRSDVTFHYHGKLIILYTDEGNANVDTDDFDFQHFDTWEELCESDYFWGKKLGEIVEEVIPDDPGYTKYTPMLAEMFRKREEGKRYRLVDTSGNTYICYPNRWTSVTIGDNEIADALQFITFSENGEVSGEVTLAGQWIKEYEEIR